ncbi:glutamate--tRNA ligase [Candidatus Gottesmanbacteria bacterium]|nr:glutamate--tRNA ligase [Candidatus Gottesmanbacteria bacterium]
MKTVRTRIAPSPTGENLHIGNAYTALINFVFAKKNNGQFIIRIEDTDRSRLVKGSEERILSSLKWLGLTYDEGPDIGGPYSPYRQSERLSLYKNYAQNLVEKGNAYYCFCTPQRLTKMREKQIAQGLPPMYDGTCKRVKSEEVRAKIKNEKYVIRLNVPEEGITEFTDVLRGKISFENKLIDDQVLIKSDGFPTYHLGVVVDDHLMKITHVIRGEEWISSTPKHILLYQAFGWDLPVFAHLPLLRNPDKSKLSKRKNPVWVSWYKEQGILPEALINYLSLMGWSDPNERDKFSLSEMVKHFKLEDIKTTAPIFDREKLKWLNKKYIQDLATLDPKRFTTLLRTMSSYGTTPEFDEKVRKVIPLVSPRISTLKEYDAISSFFHARPQKYEVDLESYQDVISKSADILENIQIAQWKSDRIGEELQKVAKATGLTNSEYFMILRVTITGKKVSPPLNESMEILGKNETIARLQTISA